MTRRDPRVQHLLRESCQHQHHSQGDYEAFVWQRGSGHTPSGVGDVLQNAADEIESIPERKRFDHFHLYLV